MSSVPRSNQLLLPFAEKEYISMRQAQGILGLSHSAVRRLFAMGKIEILDYRHRSRKRVKYSSIVSLCDRLRREYNIRDRRPPLDGTLFRHRPEDLLPFPLTDTLNLKEVLDILGYASPTSIYKMIEEGLFEAYRLGEWRISKTSLVAFLDRVHERERGPNRPAFSPNPHSSLTAHL